MFFLFLLIFIWWQRFEEIFIRNHVVVVIVVAAICLLHLTYVCSWPHSLTSFQCYPKTLWLYTSIVWVLTNQSGKGENYEPRTNQTSRARLRQINLKLILLKVYRLVWKSRQLGMRSEWKWKSFESLICHSYHPANDNHLLNTRT